MPEAIPLKAGLYLVATPIGNLRDITLRALDILRECDVIVCEDTRVSGKLLKAYEIKKQMLSYNDHSDAKRRTQIAAKISEGQAVALISDAGSPLISDPGYKLIKDCQDLGIDITSIPGPCAAITALQLSGLPSDQFAFAGFLPNKQKARRDVLEHWKSFSSTWIAYETAPRLLGALGDIYEILGERQVSVVRELTKMYEQVKYGPVSELIHYYNESGAPKGEIVLVIEGASQKSWSDTEIDQILLESLKTMKTKEATAYVSDMTGRSKKDIYQRALDLGKSL